MGKKNLLLTNKKVKKKNQILEYYIPSSGGSIKTIYNWLINKKPFNLIENWQKKLKNLWLVKNLLI